MATYSNEDFARIAVAICKDVADITPHKRSFEAAALWYRQDCRAPKSPTRVAPSAMSKKMKQIAKDARKLLRHLEVHDPREATDGPGAIALLEFLASAEDDDEDEVIRATARIGRLVEIFDSIDAARALERRADKAAEDALRIGELIVPREYQGDVVVNNWIAAMMSIYKRLTGKEPRTSVGAPGTARRGKATGPIDPLLRSSRQTARPPAFCGFLARPCPRPSDRTAAKNKSIAPFRRCSPGFPSPGRWPLLAQIPGKPTTGRLRLR